MSAARIVIFAKAPVPGRVKTRLIPALGAEGAARLAHRDAAAHGRRRRWRRASACRSCARPAPDSAAWHDAAGRAACMSPPRATATSASAWPGPRDACFVGGGRLLLIGADCPELDASGFAPRRRRSTITTRCIHPAADGGYVLLGLRRFDPSLFADIAWSTSAVARETIARIRALGWTLHVGETLQDIDRPEDIAATVTISSD